MRCVIFVRKRPAIKRTSNDKKERRMNHLLFPDAYADSVFAIDYERLWAMGYRALMFDIDNTVVHHGADSTPEVDAFFAALHKAGWKTLVLSNNSEERILRFLNKIDAPYVYEAEKPKTWGYHRALELLGVDKTQAVMIGDQVFTDVLGSNRCGIANILVRYLRRDGETKIGIRRRVEKAVLWLYRCTAWRRGKLVSAVKKGEDSCASTKTLL